MRWQVRSALSDVRGDARLRLPTGQRTIEVARLGFADTTVVFDVQDRPTNSITIELREVAIETEAVVVSATRSGMIVSEQPTRVEAVPTEEIEENLSVAPGNLTTLLEELPGVRVAPAAPALGGASLQLRGLPSRMTQVLIDGLPLLGAAADAFSLLQTPPLDLARVEVVKGAASALYGGAATAGVLNLVSKDPHSDSELLLNRSSRGESDVVGFFTHQLSPHWGATLIGSGNDQHRQDLDKDNWSEIPAYRRVVMRPRLYWSAGPSQTLLATGGFTHEGRHGGGMLADGTPYRVDLTTTRYDGGATGHVLLRNGHLLAARIAATHQQRESTLGSSTDQDRLSTAVTEVTLRGSDAGQTWLLGAALDHDALVVSAGGGSYRYRTPGVFAQDEYSPADWLSTTLSARVDVNNVYGTFFSPRAAILIRAAPLLAIRLAAGAGWVPPRPETDEVQSVGFARLQPLTNLKPERVRNTSADVDWRVSHLEISVGAFTATVHDPLNERIIDAPVARLALYNMSQARETRGIEALLHLNFGQLQLLSSYTYLHATEADSTGERRSQANLPENAGEIGVIVESEKHERIGLELGYTGRMRLEDDPYRKSSRPYWELNLLAARSFGESELFVNATNIFNVRQSSSEPLLRPTLSVLGEAATPVWGSLQGRVVNFGLRLEL